MSIDELTNTMNFFLLFKGVFHFNFLAASDGFLTGLEYLQSREDLQAEQRMWKGPTHSLPSLKTPLKTCKFSCFYAARTSRRIHATALKKAADKARCRVFYLHFAGEFNPRCGSRLPAVAVFLLVIACNFVCNCGFFACDYRFFSACDCRNCCLRFQVLLPAIAGVFACDWRNCCLRFQVLLPAIAGVFACDWRNCCLRLQVLLPAIAGVFACDWRYWCLWLQVFLPAIADIFACICGYFYLQLLVFLPASCMYFCLQRQSILHSSCGQVCAWVPHVTTCKILPMFR